MGNLVSVPCLSMNPGRQVRAVPHDLNRSSEEPPQDRLGS